MRFCHESFGNFTKKFFEPIDLGWLDFCIVIIKVFIGVLFACLLRKDTEKQAINQMNCAFFNLAKWN